MRRAIVAAALLAALTSSAFAADKCLVSMDAYTKQQIASGHKPIGTMPSKLFPSFKVTLAGLVPIKSTGVVAFSYLQDAPVTRLAFYQGKCWIDTYDLPNKILALILQKASEKAEQGSV